MRTRPADIDDRQLIEAVRQRWGVAVDSLEYVAIGGGSHHWRARAAEQTDLWLTVDDLDDKPFLGGSRAAVFEALEQAITLSSELRNIGLEFVLAPQLTTAGQPLVHVTERYTLAIYPFLEDGTTYRWGVPLPEVQRQHVVEMLIRLYQATPQVAARARKVPIELAERKTLEAAMHEPCSDGPYAQEARRVLTTHVLQVKRMLDTFDGWVTELAERGNQNVISHGEPHPRNLMRVRDGLLLIDWDTVGLALPERDLWWLARDGPAGLERYTQATGHHVDEVALRLFRLRWQLDDLIWCVRSLCFARTETRDTQLAWNALPKVVEVPEWMR